MNLPTIAFGNMNTYLCFPILLLISLVIFKRNSSKRLRLPPGPYAWPIIGNIFQMIGKKPHIVLANLAQIHGPFISLRMGAQLLVVGSSPATAAEILKTHDRILSGRCVSRPIRVKGSKLHNLSVAFYDECGDGWKNVRSMYRSELFSAKAVESQVTIRENKVTDMIRYLGSKEGEVMQIKEVVFATVLNIISNIFFSVDFVDYEGGGVGKDLRGYIRRFNELAGSPQLADLYPLLLGGFDLQSYYRKLMDIFEKICASWASIVKERRQGKVAHSSRVNFMDALIGKGVTDDQLNPILTELFGAGTESTSATSEWMLVELIRNQEAMRRLRDELENVIGGDTVRESHLPCLPYLDACVKETLRLHPPGPLLLPHHAIETCQVMGYTIPKGSLILVNMWAIARDPTIWDDPLSFKPERFLESGVDYKGQNFEYIPFGSGRRMCPGQLLASRTVSLIVASLIHSYDWSLPSNLYPVQINMEDKVDITMQKEEPLWVVPKLRRNP